MIIKILSAFFIGLLGLVMASDGVSLMGGSRTAKQTGWLFVIIGGLMLSGAFVIVKP